MSEDPIADSLEQASTYVKRLSDAKKFTVSEARMADTFQVLVALQKDIKERKLQI